MNYQDKRKALLDQMAQIERMEKGTLTAEYRDTKAAGKSRQIGPYFKHQCWENGKNVSKRVSAKEAEPLREAVDGYHRFLALSEEYANTTVEMTRKLGSSKKRPDDKFGAIQRDNSIHSSNQAEVRGYRPVEHGRAGERVTLGSDERRLLNTRRAA